MKYVTQSALAGSCGGNKVSQVWNLPPNAVQLAIDAQRCYEE